MRFLAILFLLLGCSESSRIERIATQEPPVKCTFKRDAWCLLTNSFNLGSEEFDRQENRWVWQISEPFWSDEPGFILEDPGCKGRQAVEVEIRRLQEAVWRDRRWRVVRVRLTPDCSLDLLAPRREEVRLDMASSAIATHLAICMEGMDCEKNLIAAEVYAAFKGPVLRR